MKNPTIKYYEVTAIDCDGDVETLYGSFLKADCVDELDCERESWKADGYKKIKVVSRDTTEQPDISVYGELVTKKQLFQAYAPSFNFEHDEDELLQVAFDRDFVSYADNENEHDRNNTLYLVNADYKGTI